MSISPTIEASLSDLSDSALVAASLQGDREAFSQIVSRHQALICSVAYSATGGLQSSEDIAQETFLTAWRRLRTLEDPAKLRAWLCGITRRLAHNARRRHHREPWAREASEGESPEVAAVEPLPSDEAITREQETLLWNAIKEIPENYREPLVLFYREHQSISRVAEALELSESAVKQRLSRGRKLLQAQVAAFVEGALTHTAPGAAFAVSVVALIPFGSAPATASAATLAATAKSGAASLGGASFSVFLGAILGPLVGLLGAWSGYRAGLSATRTPAEAALVKRATIQMFAFAMGSTSLIVALLFALPRWHGVHPGLLIALVTGAVLFNIIGLLVMILRFRGAMGRLRVSERIAHPEAFLDERPGEGALKYFRSRQRLFGVPLVEVRYGSDPGEPIRPAFAWFASGDLAFGLIGAVGGVACAPIAFGAVSIGLLAVGALSFGLLAMAAVAVGGFALGGLSFGVVATGGIALGWTAAAGGIALARELALGGLAQAAHVNDAVVHAWFARHPLLDIRRSEVILTLNSLWMPGVLLAWLLSRRWRVRRGAIK